MVPPVEQANEGPDLAPLSADAQSCAAHELMTIIGDRWSIPVLIELGDHGRTRSGDLKRAVEGVSQKVLTSCLRRLEDRGLIARTVDATVPVSVSYQLTPFGDSFFSAFGQLRRWADDHTSELHPTRRPTNAQ